MGCVVRPGDFDDPAGLVRAFQGVERLLLISGTRVGKRVPQHSAAIEAAKKAGVSHIVYTSFLGADNPNNRSQAVSDHRGTEAALRASGLHWTVLRDAQYSDAVTDVMAHSMVQGGVMRSVAGDVLLALATLDDAYPALNGGRDRFAMQADCRSLLVRGVSVRHRDDEYSRETVLFLEGNYASARAPLVAKLAAPVDAAHKNERAQLHFMFGRCLEKQAADESARRKELLEAALAQYGEAKRLATEARLRGRVFLQSALVEAELGRDDYALVQLAAARNNADAQNDLSSQVHLRTLAFARRLAALPDEKEDPRGSHIKRALRYLDWIAENNLRDGFAVCEAHLEAARLRLELSVGDADGKAMREAALSGLRWIMHGQYENYGRVYGPALALLYRERRSDFEREPQLPAEGDTESPGGEMLAIAARMAAGAGAYGADFNAIRVPLVSASWLARLCGRAAQAQEWLELCLGKSRGDDALWCRAELLLLAEERRLGTLEEREGAWEKFNADCRANERTAAAEALLAMSDFWADMTRESLRRSTLEWLKKNEAHWIAFARPEEFTDYLVALRLAPVKRDEAVKRLEALAAQASGGWLKLLSKRADAWLPPPNG